jgi:hypothetical protein
LLLLLAWPAAAQTDHIPLAEITRGMRGYGLTVFEGTRVDTFSVEVVGVQERMRADGSLIIIEVAGHDLQRSRIAQGMSGSPVFLDGRFAGALAFGWGGALRSLAGVTPAGEILSLPSQPLPAGARLQTGLKADLGSLLTNAQGQGLVADLLADLLVPESYPTAGMEFASPLALTRRGPVAAHGGATARRHQDGRQPGRELVPASPGHVGDGRR